MSSKNLKVVLEFDPEKFLSTRHARDRHCRSRPARSTEHGKTLALARNEAKRCARRNKFRLCTADDVYERLAKTGHDVSALGRVAGSIFRHVDWCPTRLRVRSRRASCRGREIKVWRLLPRRGGSRKHTPLGLLVTDYKVRKGHKGLKGQRCAPAPEEPLCICHRCNDILPESLGRYRSNEWICASCGDAQ